MASSTSCTHEKLSQKMSSAARMTRASRSGIGSWFCVASSICWQMKLRASFSDESGDGPKLAAMSLARIKQARCSSISSVDQEAPLQCS